MDETEAASKARELLKQFDPAAPADMANSLRRLWLEAAPSPGPPLSEGQARFMRDWGIPQVGFEAAGTPVPVLTALGKEIGRAARTQVSEFLPLARLLWDAYGREGRLVAAVALGPMELSQPERVVPVIREMAQSCVFWEDCDQLAMKALEPVLRRSPEAWLEPLGAWVTDPNKWVRRAALVAIGRLPMRRPAFTARCVELVSPALGDSDTDVKRALSFALRFCARGDVEPVKQFIEAHSRATDAHSLWVLCDVIRSMGRTLLPQFVDLLPVYRSWLPQADPKARRSVEAAIHLLEVEGQ